jgi:hypothetical protein
MDLRVSVLKDFPVSFVKPTSMNVHLSPVNLEVAKIKSQVLYVTVLQDIPASYVKPN